MRKKQKCEKRLFTSRWWGQVHCGSFFSYFCVFVHNNLEIATCPLLPSGFKLNASFFFLSFRFSRPLALEPGKDYSQPLIVDCSIEYDLPRVARPPPGAKPLLLIAPRLQYQNVTFLFVIIVIIVLVINYFPPSSDCLPAAEPADGSAVHPLVDYSSWSCSHQPMWLWWLWPLDRLIVASMERRVRLVSRFRRLVIIIIISFF